MNIIVRGNKLEFAGKTYDCAVGKNGFSAEKREGDLCCPIGEFELHRVFYRADKMQAPLCTRPTQAISENDGWCDDPVHPEYNHLVKLPLDASHEKLWRDDDLYDVVVEVGYNDLPVIAGKGSAIFMHIAKPNYAGTEGCVALKKEDLLDLLAAIHPHTKLSLNSE